MDEMTAGLSRLTQSMERSRDAGISIAESFVSLLKSLVPIEASFKALKAIAGDVATHYDVAFEALNQSRESIVEQRRQEEQRLKHVQERALVEKSLQPLADHLNKLYKEGAALHFKKLVLQDQINAAGRHWLDIGSGMLKQTAQTVTNVQKLNEALQESNSDFTHRLRTMESIARVQQLTGTQFGTIVNASKSLVRYNLDAKSTFQANLKTVVMLHDALGMATDEAAELASVAENSVHANFQAVGDVIATIVDQTALAAGEVKNLGMALTQTLGIINPGSATTLPQVIQALSGYEGALKQVSGKVGAFQKFVQHLATPEGMMSAGMLGVTPEMINTKEGIDMIMSSFERLVNQQVGQLTGIQRGLKLEIVGQAMNLTKYEVSDMTKALDIYRSQLVENVSLQDRYNNEMFNLSRGANMALSSLSSLLQQGLVPFVVALNAIVYVIGTGVQWLAKWQHAGVTAMIAVGLGAVIVASKLRSVAGAFIDVMIAAQAAQIALRAYAKQQVINAGTAAATAAPTSVFGALFDYLKTLRAGTAGTVAGAGFWKTIGTIIFNGFRSVLAPLLTGIGALTAVAAAGFAYVGYLSFRLWQEQSAVRRANEEALALSRQVADKSISMEQVRAQRMVVAARYGDRDNMDRLYNLIQQSAHGRARADKTLTPEQRKEIGDKRASESVDLINSALFTRALFDEKFVKGIYPTKEWDAERLELEKELLLVTKNTFRQSELQFLRETQDEIERNRVETEGKLLRGVRNPFDAKWDN